VHEAVGHLIVTSGSRLSVADRQLGELDPWTLSDPQRPCDAVRWLGVVSEAFAPSQLGYIRPNVQQQSRQTLLGRDGDIQTDRPNCSRTVDMACHSLPDVTVGSHTDGMSRANLRCGVGLKSD